jgi:hypothetical protein
MIGMLTMLVLHRVDHDESERDNNNWALVLASVMITMMLRTEKQIRCGQ